MNVVKLTGQAAESTLEWNDVCKYLADQLPLLPFKNKRILCLIPDQTRTCPMGQMLREISAILTPSVARLDVLIALGTHAPLTESFIDGYLGFTPELRAREFPKTTIFNHHWNDPKHLISLPTITAQKMSEITGGIMAESVVPTINKLITEYDHLLVIGPTFPHEVVGFSGGNKYFFPGIAGQEVIDSFHWLGALLTNRDIIGTLYTPVRSVVDYCASLIPTPRWCLSMVTSRNGLHGLFLGKPEDTYREAALFSGRIHIKWMPRSYNTVLSMCPAMYEEMWLAGKCAYKLEPVMAQGGKLIIYAPHVHTISHSHGEIIEKIGYHTLPYFTHQMEKFSDIPRGIMAHSTHVRGGGKWVDGREAPHHEVILATGIPKDVCDHLGLGYMDPNDINPENYSNREEEGILKVPHAGEILYKLESERPVE